MKKTIVVVNVEGENHPFQFPSVKAANEFTEELPPEIEWFKQVHTGIPETIIRKKLIRPNTYAYYIYQGKKLLTTKDSYVNAQRFCKSCDLKYTYQKI